MAIMRRRWRAEQPPSARRELQAWRHLEDDALEASNVNISSEFSDLIVAQRAFEANAKSVTTFDTVTQDTINMVH